MVVPSRARTRVTESTLDTIAEWRESPDRRRTGGYRDQTATAGRADLAVAGRLSRGFDGEEDKSENASDGDAEPETAEIGLFH